MRSEAPSEASGLEDLTAALEGSRSEDLGEAFFALFGEPPPVPLPQPAAEIGPPKVLAEPAALRPPPVPPDELERRARLLQWAWEKKGMKSTTYEELVHDLLLEDRPLIIFWAQQVHSKLPPHFEGMDFGDMISVATLGFLEALGNYDPARAVELETYAGYRVKGAILDELRGVDPEGRVVRTLANDLKAEGRIDWGVDEVASLYRVTRETAQRALVVARGGGTVSLERTVYEKKSGKAVLKKNLLADLAQQDPTLKAEQEDLIRFLTRYLSPTEKLILFLYYHEGLTNKQIAQTMGYSEGWISQLLTKIHQELREQAQRFREGSPLMRLDSFASRVRYARLANALSIEEAIRATGFWGFSGYETGHIRHPQPGGLEKLAKAYQVNVEWLASGEGVPEFLDARYLEQASTQIKGIEEERQRKRISVGRLAKAAGINPAAYPFYLRGEVLPAPAVLEKIQEALKNFPEYQRKPRKPREPRIPLKSDTQILAALERLKAKGPGRPTLVAIAKEAGVGPKTVRARKKKNPQVAAAIEAAQRSTAGPRSPFSGGQPRAGLEEPTGLEEGRVQAQDLLMRKARETLGQVLETFVPGNSWRVLSDSMVERFPALAALGREIPWILVDDEAQTQAIVQLMQIPLPIGAIHYHHREEWEEDRMRLKLFLGPKPIQELTEGQFVAHWVKGSSTSAVLEELFSNIPRVEGASPIDWDRLARALGILAEA